MKHRDSLLLLFLTFLTGVLIFFAGDAKNGAKDGLLLAENTILPSLLPALILFYIIMKSGANRALIRLFGNFSYRALKLPRCAFSAILFGLLGGYPTGAILTQLLFKDGEISKSQARRIMRFNLCGGVGFIITAVGTVTLSSINKGIILLTSNIIASLIIALLTAIPEKRDNCAFETLSPALAIGDALNESVSAGMKSVLNITAYIVLFSSFNAVVHIPKFLTPIFEITNGICSGNVYSLPVTAFFLAFGGFCIHFQIFGILRQFDMRYLDFLTFRILNSFLSYFVCRALLFVFPQEETVFSNVTATIAEPSVLNTALSFLLIVGSFVMIYDLNSRKRKI